MEESLILLKEKFHLKETWTRTSTRRWSLPIIGDAVYELLIRTMVVSDGSMQVNKLHKKVFGSCEGCRPGGIPDGHRG